MIDPFEALTAETSRTGELLASFGDAEWALPTRCDPLVVRELAAHMLRGAMRLLELADTPVEGEAEKDAVTYCRYDGVAEAPMIARRAREAAEGRSGAQIASAWTSDWPEAIAAAKALGEHVMVPSPVDGARMLMTEYAKTRVLEVTIHTLDVRHALGLSPDPTADGIETTCGILRGLLGTDLRVLGVDDIRFALTATGREPLDDAERDLLGPLADLFPLLV